MYADVSNSGDDIIDWLKGPNKTLISNYPTPEALQVCSGGMCERCGTGTNTVLQLQQTYAHNKCGLWNQSCVLQYRAFGNNGQHGGNTRTPYQPLQNASIATFLMAMGPYSYYGGGSETGIGKQSLLIIGPKLLWETRGFKPDRSNNENRK